MTETENHILTFANGHAVFTGAEVVESFPQPSSISRATIEWHLGQLTKNGKINRIKRGTYTANTRPDFIPYDSELDIKLSEKISRWFPGAKVCVYKGTVFSSLQHHLSYNALTYIETDRGLTEVLFHRLKETEPMVFLKPDKQTFNDYVDISRPGIIIKPLVSGSPLKTVAGVLVPTLEKLLVDIRCDADFDYLGGAEGRRMLENALSLYTVNTTKLLRYAGRRHRRELFEKELKEIER